VTALAEIGVPVGRPQTVVVDLTGRFLSASRKVRIATTMQVFWDRAAVADGAEVIVPADAEGARRAGLRVDRLGAPTATLRWRGYSAERSPDGREPAGYEYDAVSALAPWKSMPGRYTRVGDVAELVAAVDDRFVISRPGDEVALSFDASTLSPLAPGERRTFLVHAVGYSKEMDVNSASPDAAGPLPFRAMPRYPYAPQLFPDAARLRDDVERFHTRVVRRMLPALELSVPHTAVAAPSPPRH
jgi:hypothetical protein